MIKFLQAVWLKFMEGGIYMVPIFLLSALMFALIMHCLFTYFALNRSLKAGANRAEPSDVGGLEDLLSQYCASRSPDPEINIRLREDMGRTFLARLGTEGKAILLCGSIAMLMGLLGTVSGMINAFETIQSFGVGNTKSFASGISEALLTTQSGLLVGVIGVIIGQLMKRMHKRLGLRLYRSLEDLEDNAGTKCGACPYGA